MQSVQQRKSYLGLQMCGKHHRKLHQLHWVLPPFLLPQRRVAGEGHYLCTLIVSAEGDELVIPPALGVRKPKLFA